MVKNMMAMIGMGVMGSMLAQNFAEKGYDIAIYNRTEQKTHDVYECLKREPYAKRIHPITGGFENLVKIVGKKGIYFFIVKAGEATEGMIKSLLPHLSSGAVVVDLANSNYKDTNRLNLEINKSGIHFFGCGVSGGEEGARHGPSIMPGGGNKKVYDETLKKAFEAISGKAPQDGKPCVTYLGPSGAGHFVKMVHNGIEYGDMQLIAESYDLMNRALRMPPDEISKVFEKWNKGILKSFLIEITAEVLKQKDLDQEGYLIDKILDKAKMKGTGTWTIQSSLEMESGVVPIPTIYSAVESRAISYQKDIRTRMNKKIRFDIKKDSSDKKTIIDDLEKALYLSKIASYTQGIELIKEGYRNYGYGVPDISKIAEIWRAGCIIRAEFLGDITEGYKKEPEAVLIELPNFKKVVVKTMDSLKNITRFANDMNLPMMAFDSSRNYLLQITSDRLPANMIQGLRDFFGAHTYERVDKEGSYHVTWSEDRKEIKK